MINKSFQQLITNLLADSHLIQGVISSPRLASHPCQKVSIRPIEIKQSLVYQVSYTFKDKTTHSNVSAQEAARIIESSLAHDFKQGVFFTTTADYHILVNKNKEITTLKKAPTKQPTALKHNLPKKHLLAEGTPIPFLVELGLMTQEGRVIAKKSDKFKQINRFLEMIADIVPHLRSGAPLHIIDFGCGKAYLTFALYHYLHNVKGLELDVVGLDLKESVIKDCQDIADRLHFANLRFAVGDIAHYTPTKNVDMVITLHACDTATDAALEKAVRWNADVILSVPCCQHELYSQISNNELRPLLHHGILKERFAALATDAARAQILEIVGYQTQILEFIDLEHTPKNLLIRAIRRPSNPGKDLALKQYMEFKKLLNITPCLEKLVMREKLKVT